MCTNLGIILGMGSANERRCFIVTSSVTGWAHTQSDLCITYLLFSFDMNCSTLIHGLYHMLLDMYDYVMQK